MVTQRQIEERLHDEKDPLQYIDGEVARCISQMGNRCENIQDVISIYNHRVDENDPIDMQKIKEELIKLGELYYEVNLYLKVRKEQVKRQKRIELINKAQVKHQEWIGQISKSTPNK